VKLRSADPHEKPVITTNYLSEERDRISIREGIRLARRIASTPVLANFLADEVFPGVSVQSDAALDEYIRSTVHSSNALTGTCKMGKGDDAVVDTDLKVRRAYYKQISATALI
jgi:choline dehydrogenase